MLSSDLTSTRAIEVLSATALQMSVEQLAADIAKACPNVESLVLIGIYTRGVPLAHRLAQLIAQHHGSAPAVGALDITFFRDDLQRLGLRTPDQSQIPRDLTQQQVILVDDVIFRGRTIRAALDALHHWGRPQQVRLAVLIDRGHRELPIQPDFRGQLIPTDPSDQVRVHLLDPDGEERVLLYPGQQNLD